MIQPMCRIFVTSVLVTVAVLVATRGFADDSLSVTTEFPGGSGEVLAMDVERGTIHLCPSLRPERGWPCWWYVRIDGAEPGRALQIRVSSNDGFYRPGRRLAASWAQPRRAAVSGDNEHWEQTEPAERLDDGSVVYNVTVPAERFWVAWGPPFLRDHVARLWTLVQGTQVDAKQFVLARTRGNRSVKGLVVGRIGDPKAPAVWIQSRQHAWEAGSSWVSFGLVEWLTGQEPAAVALRRTCAVHIVPIMDVDNVMLGAGGKEAVPRDHNRDWSDDPVYPEVAAAQQSLSKLSAAGRLQLFIDLHNPGPGDLRPFFYGPFPQPDMSGDLKAQHARWIEIARSTINGPPVLEPNYRVASYIRTDEERRRMSGEWVREHCGTVAITLETPWNTDHNRASDYRRIGAQLGRAISRFVSEP